MRPSVRPSTQGDEIFLVCGAGMRQGKLNGVTGTIFPASATRRSFAPRDLVVRENPAN